MNLPEIQLGDLSVRRLIAGSNAISGVSHASAERSQEMKRYFTVARIKEHWTECERAGVDAVVARADNFIMRVLDEHWCEGGSIKWIAQTAPEHRDPVKLIGLAAKAGARAIYVHGGEVDRLLATGDHDRIKEQLEAIRARGLPAGLASHMPENHRRLLDLGIVPDFHLVCLYRVPGYRGRLDEEPKETFEKSDRPAALDLLASLPGPAIAYKVCAAGRLGIEEALADVLAALRPQDGVLIGMYPPDAPDIVRENVRRVAAGPTRRREVA